MHNLKRAKKKPVFGGEGFLQATISNNFILIVLFAYVIYCFLLQTFYAHLCKHIPPGYIKEPAAIFLFCFLHFRSAFYNIQLSFFLRPSHQGFPQFTVKFIRSKNRR